MLEARRWPAKLVLQIVATILVLPFLFPLVAMVEESLSGTGWNNYATVLAIPELPVFFRNSLIIAVGGYYASTELSYVFAFTFFIVLMFIRPRGLFTP